MTTPIIISQKDIHLIHALFAQSEFISPLDHALREELMRLTAASVTPSKKGVQTPVVGLYDAVTVNEISAPPSNSLECQIVLPHEADLDDNRFSVLAPVSMALLGRSLGSTVAFESPGGPRQLHILAIRKETHAPQPTA